MKAGYSDEVSYYLCILVFCGFWGLIGKSSTELEGMTKIWQERMASLGWTVPAEDFCWGTTEENNVEMKIKLGDKVLKRVKRTEGVNVLGTILTFDGKTNVEFSNRCDKAWAAFWARKDIFRRFEANLFKRMRMLERFVGPSLLWCAGSWKLTKQQRKN